MKKSLLSLSTICWMAAAMLIFSAGTMQAAEAKDASGKKPEDIYDKSADGNKQIAEALDKAKTEHKRVILQFGANWCGWCHKLSNLFKSDPAIAARLKESYIVVLVDVDQVEGKQHNADVAAKYGNPLKHGLPVIVVLNAEGTQLHTQDTGLLEDGNHHDPTKVLAFLNKWKA